MTNTTPAPIGADALIAEIMAAAVSAPYSDDFGRLDKAKAALRAALASAAQPGAPTADVLPDEPTMTVTMRYDVSPASIEGAIRDKLIEMGWTPPGAAAPKAVPAAQGDAPTPDVQAKIDSNTWDSLSEVLPVLKSASRGKWGWPANPRCKYIELRIDMRDGGCLIRDREGVRISPEQLAHQSHPGGLPWSSSEVDGVRPAAQGDALDAARYRWLRANAAEFFSCVMDATGLHTADEREADEAIDAEINAARAAKEGGADVETIPPAPR